MSRCRKYPHPIKYQPVNPSKYVGNLNEIVLRSSWERKLALYFDTNPSIKKWGSEIKAIPYYSRVSGRVRRYFPDFWVLREQPDGTQKRFIVEVKPRSQTQPPKKGRNRERYLNEMSEWYTNQDKWEAAKEFSKKNGFEFIILDEYALGIIQ